MFGKYKWRPCELSVAAILFVLDGSQPPDSAGGPFAAANDAHVLRNLAR
jgi:hypothetical protein